LAVTGLAPGRSAHGRHASGAAPALDGGTAPPQICRPGTAWGMSMPLDDSEMLQQAELDPYSAAVVRAFETVGPAVVHIGAFDGEAARGSGSGVLFTPDVYLLTNSHVVARASRFQVGLQDGRRVAARRVGDDPATDLAVLQLEVGGLPHAAFGRSSRLRVGQ